MQLYLQLLVRSPGFVYISISFFFRVNLLVLSLLQVKFVNQFYAILLSMMHTPPAQHTDLQVCQRV